MQATHEFKRMNLNREDLVLIQGALVFAFVKSENDLFGKKVVERDLIARLQQAINAEENDASNTSTSGR